MIESLTGQGIDVRRACLMLGVSCAGYYAWRERPPSARTLRHAWLAGEIVEVHKASAGTYGSLRVTAELRYGRGITVGHNQVELLNRKRWKTRVELATAIHDYIEIWHNTRRRHSALNMLTPIEYEKEHQRRRTAA